MKYKLIKAYPGIPAIVDYAEIDKAYPGSVYKLIDKEGNYSGSIQIYNIENFPDFWEEIKEFSYKTADGINICDPNQIVYGYNRKSKNIGPINGIKVENAWRFNESDWLYFSTILARNEYMESIKPKVILITEDKVTISNPDTILYGYHKITKEKTTIVAEKYPLYGHGWIWFLNLISRDLYEESLKGPVFFTTTDGVKMYKGDRYWYVTNKYDIFSYTIQEEDTMSLYKTQNIENKRFSTEKLAKKYIFENKPLFSLHDSVF